MSESSSAAGSEALREALARLHERADAWGEVIEGVAAEASSPGEAMADPRLEAAEAAFEDALSSVHTAAGSVLGMPAWEDPEEDDGDLEVEELLADDFYLHFEVAVPQGTSPEALDRVLDLVDEGGHGVAEALRRAGFTVPLFTASRGGLVEEGDGLDDDPEDGAGDPGGIDLR